MAAQQRIIPQQDNPFKALDDIMWFVNNPDQYKAAQEAIREQMQLNEEAKQKLIDGQKFIADYETKKKEIEDGQNALKSAQDNHAKTVSDWQDSVNAAHDKLDTRAINLQTISDQQIETAKAQVRAELDNKKYKQQLDDDYAQKFKDLTEREQSISKANVDHKNEAARLLELRAKLEAKLAKFKEAEAL